MSTKLGKLAEQAAAIYLQKQGYEVLEKNWRTRWCEIDIIARKQHTIHFVEVKYRIKQWQGAGLDYITTQKLRQMQFAAEFWLSCNQHDNYEYSLAAVEVSGENFAITAWIEDI